MACGTGGQQLNNPLAIQEGLILIFHFILLTRLEKFVAQAV